MWKKLTTELVMQLILHDRLRNIDGEQFSITQISADHKSFEINGDPITRIGSYNFHIGYKTNTLSSNALVTNSWEIFKNIQNKII